MPAPNTVILIVPVAAIFRIGTTLKVMRSEEKARLRHPTARPTDNETRIDLEIDLPVRQLTDESEYQVDASHEVLPNANFVEKAARPNPPPSMLTLLDPVAAPFTRLTRLNRSVSKDNVCETEPDRIPVVTISCCVLAIPCDIWPLIEESLSHELTSQPVEANLTFAH